MPSLPSSKAQQTLIAKVLPQHQPYSPREGQLALVKKLAADPTIQTIKAVFPTGYGKTDAIELSYKLAKLQGRVDALMIIVPSKEQLSSYLNGIEGDFRRKWGDEIVAYRISSNLLKIVARDVVQNKCEVIVVTCQALMSPNNLDLAKRLLKESGRRWMVALDELHRYGEETTWGTVVGSLLEAGPELVLGLTAAEQRTDGMPVAMAHPDETIVVSTSQAIKEKAIRPFRAHVHDYSVTVELEGEFHDVTTKELSELQGEYIEKRKAAGVPAHKAKAEARDFLAYKDKYISPLVQNAVDCLRDKRQKLDRNHLLSTKHHRLLVFARDQKHAEHLQNYFVKYNDLAADWIGEKRPDELNERVLKDFIDGNLDVMINVNKASEGFNCVQCSVMLFLNDVGPSVMILQQLGRGLRRNYDMEWEKDICNVFLSEDHPAKAYFLDQEALQPRQFTKDGPTDGPGTSPIYDIPPVMFGDVRLQAVRIVDGMMQKQDAEPMLVAVKSLVASQGNQEQADLMTLELMKEALVQLNWNQAEQIVQSTSGSTDRLEQARRANAEAVKTLAGNIVRALSLGNFNKSRLPDTNKAINVLLKKKFGSGTDSMGESELIERQNYIREINTKLKESSHEDFAKSFPTLCIA
jgi:superfamily II DNA or RNA helicase